MYPFTIKTFRWFRWVVTRILRAWPDPLTRMLSLPTPTRFHVFNVELNRLLKPPMHVPSRPRSGGEQRPMMLIVRLHVCFTHPATRPCACRRLEIFPIQFVLVHTVPHVFFWEWYLCFPVAIVFTHGPPHIIDPFVLQDRWRCTEDYFAGF